MSSYDEERLAMLLRALPAPPRGWVEAAQELPLARLGLDDIVARAELDAAFREALTEDVDSTLAREGYEPDFVLHRAVRRRLRKPKQ